MPIARFSTLLLLICITLGWSGNPVLGWEESRTSTASPNVVLIVADDLGFGELGCYGQKIIQTPHLDQMAKDGVRFTRFYSGNNVCAPSRCCLMTGKHPGHAFIRDNQNPKGLDDLKAKYGWEFPGQIPIPENEFTLPELMKRKGYATAAFGKWGLGHVGTTGDPAKHGFDLFYGYYCQVHAHNHYPKFLWRNQTKEQLPGNNATLSGAIYSQDRFVEEAMQFIEGNQKQPFFLYLPFIVPHLSIQVPDDSTQAYEGTIQEEDYKHTSYLQHPKPRAAYAGMVSRMDQGIGKILKKLDELRLSENTVVIFTSDNGATYGRLGGTDSDYFDSAPQCRGRKGSMYEGGIRTPMIVQWKGKIAANRQSPWIGAFWDVLPTIADMVQAPIPSGLDGMSFYPELIGTGKQAEHEFLYWESPGYGGQQAVRLGSWKGTRQQLQKSKKDKTPPVLELYQLDEDPAESQNVAEKHPEIVQKIEAIMKSEHVPSSTFPLQAID